MYTFDADIVCPWVIEKAGGFYTSMCTGIGKLEDGKLAAGVMYDGYNGENSCVLMHWRVDNPKVTDRTFYWLAFDYPFNQLLVKRVYGIVEANNAKVNDIDKRLGFKFEHLLRDYFPDGDAILYSMTKDECRWLKRREANHEGKDNVRKPEISPIAH